MDIRRCPVAVAGLFAARSLTLLAADSGAAQLEYSRDVVRWEAIEVPPRAKNPDRVVWNFAAVYSPLTWRVYLENGRPSATLTDSVESQPSVHPPFDPRADEFRGANRFLATDDGWLVGFNHGEFGAALYWFSRDGRRHYRISYEHVVAFFPLRDGIYAIEGMAHMGISCGSVIRIVRPAGGHHWQTVRFVRLPYAPESLALKRDGTMLIALSDSLVAVSLNGQIETLIPDAPWANALYPGSSIITADESRLYIGMRQYVAEVDLATNALRLLVPSGEFLNHLPADMEQRIRIQYRDGQADISQPTGICELMEAKARAAGRH